MRSWVTSSATMSSVSTVRPSRMIVVVSAISAISLSLWEIMIDVMPCALSWRRRPSRCSESLSLSAAVGSSRISSLTCLDSALAISTSCCLPTPSWPTGVTGSSSSPTRARRAAASELATFQSISPRCERSLPRKMFSAMERKGTSASSWWMITMPLDSESLIDPNSTSSPSKRIEPSYVPCGYTPDSTFISVDLPAPFSPQIAWISPRSTDIETSCSALTPGKVFVMARISRMGLAMGLPPSFVVQGATVGTPR